MLERRVVLLETDERAGLVAAVATACAARDVSMEISTGPGHVLIMFSADAETTAATVEALECVPGVAGVHAYRVAAPDTAPV